MQFLCHSVILKLQKKLIIYIGNCLEATVGKVIEHTCENFLSGCPNETFFDYGFYKCK